MGEGLRERKKRQTRQRIAEVAVGLFVERGFDRVTIAEVAAAAEVSVNTLYNYFQSKEDLVLPPEKASPHRLADIVREREVGQSAARAVLARLRAEVRRRDPAAGLSPGFPRVFEMMRAAPTLIARLETRGREMTEELARLLVAETGASPDDLVPQVVASQVGWLHATLYGEIGRRIVEGESADQIAEAALRFLDVAEELLGDRVLDHAVREESVPTVAETSGVSGDGVRAVFRVTVRGVFEELDETRRQALLAEVDGFPAFTEAGTFTYDRSLSAFTFRCEVPVDGEDPEVEADPETWATLRALAALDAHGYPYRVLRVGVTDLRAVKVNRKSGRGGKSARGGGTRR